MVLAGTLPADLMAVERSEVYELKRQKPPPEVLAERIKIIKSVSMVKWQERWSTDTGTAAWTKRLLPSIERWQKGARKLEMTYHLTQALSGHGCFRQYLHKRKRATTPHCLWCTEEEEDAEHTIFKCTKYTPERAALTSRLGREPTAEDVQTILCGDDRTRFIEFEPLARNIVSEEDRRRKLFVEMITNILTDKEEDERRRQDEGRRAAAAVRRGANRRGGRARRNVPARGRTN